MITGSDDDLRAPSPGNLRQTNDGARCRARADDDMDKRSTPQPPPKQQPVTVTVTVTVAVKIVYLAGGVSCLVMTGGRAGGMQVW
jgi:hypothetical protein